MSTPMRDFIFTDLEGDDAFAVFRILLHHMTNRGNCDAVSLAVVYEGRKGRGAAREAKDKLLTALMERFGLQHGQILTLDLNASKIMEKREALLRDFFLRRLTPTAPVSLHLYAPMKHFCGALYEFRSPHYQNRHRGALICMASGVPNGGFNMRGVDAEALEASLVPAGIRFVNTRRYFEALDDPRAKEANSLLTAVGGLEAARELFRQHPSPFADALLEVNRAMSRLNGAPQAMLQGFSLDNPVHVEAVQVYETQPYEMYARWMLTRDGMPGVVLKPRKLGCLAEGYEFNGCLQDLLAALINLGHAPKSVGALGQEVADLLELAAA